MKSTINTDWTTFKNIFLTKNLNMQFIDVNNRYYIITFDGHFSVSCVIEQTGNNDQIDFETNYKNISNKLLAFAASGTLTDRSGSTSITPATSTQIMALNTNRKYLFIQNIDVAPIWINFTTNANIGSPSIVLSPGSSFVMEGTAISTESVNVISQLPNISYTAKEK